MKLVFEGAPAVGKSTVSKALKNHHHCQVVPEVNVLFGKEMDTHLWYYEKQVERWNLATVGAEKLSVLDGDIFQPVWFKTLFSDEDWGSYEEMIEFYLAMLKDKRISFPDKYVFFYIDEKTRAARERKRSEKRGKSADHIRQRIERYRKLAVQQYDYFLKLSDAFPDLVVFIESSDISTSVDNVLSLSLPHNYKDSDIFQFILDWRNETLKQNRLSQA